jgi:hypothetical protein
MRYDSGAARRAAGGAARFDGRTDHDPTPIPSGMPPGELWCPAGLKPDPFEFMGALPTERCWVYPCPCPWCSGWVALLPCGWDSYRIAEIGCSADCDEDQVHRWQFWRLGMPMHEPLPADEQSRRRAAGIVRRILEDLPEQPSERQLTGAAYQSGRWLEQGALPAEMVADPLLTAAARAGLDPATIAPKLAAALTAGRARPGRLSP